MARLRAKRPTDGFTAVGLVSQIRWTGGKGSGPANMSKGVLVEFADGLDVRVGKVKSGGDSKESPSSWPNGGAIC